MRDDSSALMRDDSKKLERDVGQPYAGQTCGLAIHKLSMQSTLSRRSCKNCTRQISEESNRTAVIDVGDRHTSIRLNEGNLAARTTKLAQVVDSNLHVNEAKRELLHQLLEDHVNGRYTQYHKENNNIELYKVSVLPSDIPSLKSLEFQDVYEALCNIDVIIDTGATCHCFPMKSIFTDYTELTMGSRKITYADGSTSNVAGSGNTCLLTNVLHVPSMKLGIISISLLDRAGYASMFDDNKVIITDKEFEHILMSGTLVDGLYKLDDIYLRALADNQCNYPAPFNDGPINFKAEQHVYSKFKRRKRMDAEEQAKHPCGTKYKEDEDVSLGSEDTRSTAEEDDDQYETDTSEGKHRVIEEQNNNNIIQKGKIRLENNNDNLLMKLHKRYGHLGENNIKLAYKKNIIYDNKYTYNDIKYMSLGVCPDCMRGRMKSFPAGSTTRHNWEIFQKVAMDYKGPIKKKSREGYSGFYLFSDYKSDFVWAYPVQAKSEGGEALRKFHDIFIKRRSAKLKQVILEVIQSDVDSVIQSKVSKTLLNKLNIRLQLSPAYKYSHNGQIERDMQNVLDKARTLLASYDVPIQWWWKAIQHSIYCINRSPTSKGDNKSPLEQVYNLKPNIDDMVPFYSPGLYHVTKEERMLSSDKVWAAKARPCRFLGYDPENNGYIIYDLLSQKIVENRADIIWDPNLIERWYRSSNDLLGSDVKPTSRTEHDLEESKSVNESDNEDDIIPMKYESDSKSEESEEAPYWNISNYTISSNHKDETCYQLMLNFSIIDTIKDFEVEVDSKQSLYDRVNRILKRNIKSENFWFTNGVEEELDQYVLHIINMINNTELINKLPLAPKNEKEALSLSNPDHFKWKEAIEKELEVLEKYNVFEEADQVGHAMKTKFVFTVTYRSDYSIKYKARLVVCGYSQIKDIDYTETYSPTVGMESVFILLFLCGYSNFDMAIFDVASAFLEGRADCIQYCRLPLCASSGNTQQRVKIIGNLYGEKQAPKVWNDKLNEILLTLGFKRCPWDACLYKCWTSFGKCLFLSIHVDDGLILGDQASIKWFNEALLKHVKEATLFQKGKDKLIKYIGIEIEDERGTDTNTGNETYKKMLLSQREKISGLNHYPESADTRKKIKTPMPANTNLRDEEPNPENKSLLNVTGSLRFICDRTRPDILVATGELSTGAVPSDLHIKIAERVEQYLKNTIHKVLKLGGKGMIKHFAFCDATYITTGKAKSRLGHCQFLGMDSGAIKCLSQNDKTVSHSSMESEIKSLDLLVVAIILTRNIMEFLGYKIDEPTTVFIDNKSAIELCKTLKQNHRARNINMRIQFIRECINNRLIELVFIRSEDNVADVLTKPLDKVTFDRHTDKLFNGFGGNIDYLYNNSVTYIELCHTIDLYDSNINKL